ncbi:MAG: STAS domain-containing protein [Burkholderiaceae bacterium]
MSKDDSNGGFLSKVVKFVRHRSDLDTRAADRESEYSKAALKEMIERKRRNDFVRKREFDMLRKIRSREATSGNENAGVRPSFFQSSLPSKPDDRALTLKKIDEIEAQMSMQWWKTKGPDSMVSTGSGLNTSSGTPLEKRQAREEAGVARADARRQQQYNETEPAHLATKPPTTLPSPVPVSADTVSGTLAPEDQREWSPSKERELASDVAAAPRRSKARTGLMAPAGQMPASSYSNSDPSSSFSASHFYAMDVQEIAQDPEVEEAAIRFANGDDAGAEQGLLESLTAAGGRLDEIEDWLALFDLYRATGQMAPFESRAVDFVNRFDRSAPQFYDMPAMVSQLAGRSFKPSVLPGRVVWLADEELDAHAVSTLQNILLRAEQPWVLDWSAVESIDLKAARALLGIFTLWSDQEVDLRWYGTGPLRDLLKSLTPSGRRDVEQIWWELRMALLRLMNRPDEFELTALDFCVTYELSPPGWERPRCHFQALSAEGMVETGQSVLGDGMLEPLSVPTESGESVMDSQGLSQLGLVELSGEIRGDPQETLDGLEARLKGADIMIISCRNLIRVDFSAAGTLLNWVSAHHAEGRMIQFVDVHRLVSAFFHVIGITEHAKVVLRND